MVPRLKRLDLPLKLSRGSRKRPSPWQRPNDPLPYHPSICFCAGCYRLVGAVMGIQVKCSHCQSEFSISRGHFNRAASRGANLYCGLRCSGLARRVYRTDAEKKRLKADYDRVRRAEKSEEIKAKKAAYYQRTRNPEKEAATRKARAHLHAEYCRRPEYKKWKRDYDRQHRAQKQYGEFADCFLLAMDIRQECLSRQSDYEIRLAAGTLSKSQKRKRDYERAYSDQPQASIMGNTQ